MNGTVPLTLRPVTNRLVKAYLRVKFASDPIIVGGPPRSGTTLLLSLLGSHPHIHAVDYETTAFHPGFQPEKLFTALFFENESRALRKIPASKRRFAEKTPGNVRHADQINAFFDNKVKIVNIFRDARDVLTSRHPLNPDQYWVPIERWAEDVKRGLQAERLPNVFSIKYEDLVGKTEATIRAVCDFIGERFDDRMLNYQKHTNVSENLAWHGKAQAIHARSVRKWEKPEHAERIKEFFQNEAAVALYQRLGYS